MHREAYKPIFLMMFDVFDGLLTRGLKVSSFKLHVADNVKLVLTKGNGQRPGC
jgi:hypothetical protein